MKKTLDDKPSEVIDEYYIWAERQKDDYPQPTERNGKWLIFVDKNNIDEVWAKIKKTTEEGLLGGSAKVATAKPNSLAHDPDKRVICVYTYDWTDKEDTMRVRSELRKIGITQKISYKSDEDTSKGKYNARGYKNISKYYE
jgi:hypothetical protein